MATIQFVQGSLQGQAFKVDPAGARLGSGGRCELQLEDPGVAAKHVSVSKERGRWVATELDRRAGMFVNGERSKKAPLQDGDVVQFGEAAFRVHLAEEAGSPAGVSGPGSAVAGTEAGGDSMSGSDRATIDELKERYAEITEEIRHIIVGQEAVVEEVLLAIFCRSHALLVGVPGLAKTLLVSTLSEVLDLSFKRIQFTPDLMPADITGTEVLEEDVSTGSRGFRFVRGPIFANLVLADEINRTPPKTQAALLEAMQERHVTVGEMTYPLPRPFFVLATQNPIEQEGTYPLPEAQLDRFMFNIKVGYPSAEEEQQIIKRVSGMYEGQPQRCLGAEDILRLQDVVRRVPAADHVVELAATLARATRPAEDQAPDFVKDLVSWGAGPRAGINLILAAKARAILYGRYHVTTADVQAVAAPVLRHRVILNFNAQSAGMTSDDLVAQLLDHVKPKGRLGL